MLTTICIGLLSLWLGLSTLAQFNLAPLRVLKRHDAFSLLPRWSFFAPRPGTFDYHLLYRDQLAGGPFGCWQEIPLGDERTLLGAIWNPDKRCRKALSDAVRSLIQLSQSKDRPPIVMTVPYLATLNYVSSRRHEEGAAQVQFMILRTNGYLADGEPQFVYLSSLHEI